MIKTLMIITYLSYGISTQIVDLEECRAAERNEDYLSYNIECVPME